MTKISTALGGFCYCINIHDYFCWRHHSKEALNKIKLREEKDSEIKALSFNTMFFAYYPQFD